MNTNPTETNNKINSGVKFAYFGTDSFATIVLDELRLNGLVPTLIITTPDKPKGRKLILSPTPVKNWAIENNIEFITPENLKTDEVIDKIKSFGDFDVFIVASYGKIIPKKILDLPKYKTLNIHPSLLPKLRGPSPIESAILNEKETGVSIMILDEEVDHGPILIQEKLNIDWPPYADELERASAELGSKLLADILPKWINGEVKEMEQNHSEATFTKKIDKVDAEINLKDSAELNLRKIRGFNIWPNAYLLKEIKGEKKRIIVKKAHIENNELVLERVIPEGKKEMNYEDFLRGIKE